MAEKAVRDSNHKVFWVLCYGFFAALIYYFIFAFNDTVAGVILSKKLQAPLLAMFIVIVTSWLYGGLVSVILKNTLEKRLNSKRNVKE